MSLYIISFCHPPRGATIVSDLLSIRMSALDHFDLRIEILDPRHQGSEEKPQGGHGHEQVGDHVWECQSISVLRRRSHLDNSQKIMSPPPIAAAVPAEDDEEADSDMLILMVSVEKRCGAATMPGLKGYVVEERSTR